MKRLLLLLPFGFSVVLFGGDVGQAVAERVGSQTAETVGRAAEGQVREAAATGRSGESTGVMSQQQAREIGLARFLRFIRNGSVSFVKREIQKGRPVTAADLAYARNISHAYDQRIAALQRSAGRQEKSMQENYKKIIKTLEDALQGSASEEGQREDVGVPANPMSSSG